ncbi:MAG TPA: glycine oxidase ThiO [Lichenihabitans sp.]|nr:glycine oxidase ThiO [Lichenihabitans sp.]
MVEVPVLFRSLRAAPALRPAAAPLPRKLDVAIVGAGVIGLSIAWRLAARGLDVGLFEAGTTGGGTSAAATGMLAASAEHEPGGDSLLGLGLESQRLWPAFRDDLEAGSAQSIDYRAEGTLVVAVGRDETERLRARHDLQRRAGLDTRWLSASQAREREPGLTPAVTGGILCPEDHQVDPLGMTSALRAAFLAAGGQLFEATQIDGLERSGGRVTGVAADGRTIQAGTTLLATGAAAGVAPWPSSAPRLPIRPLKGQSLTLRGRTGPLPMDHVVWTAEIHLAPKSDGRLILGATMEEAGFDCAVTAGGLLALLDAARRVLPGLEEMAIEEIRTGFRPTSDDDAPILGELAPGLLVAAGHHRNGYLLAPVTARAIEDLITTGRMQGAAATFGPGRFAEAILARGAA